MITKQSYVRVMIAFLLVLSMGLTSITTVADAYTTKHYKGFSYVVKGSGAKYGSGAYIRGYHGNKSKVTIPKKIGKHYVVSVDLDEEHLSHVTVRHATKLKNLDVSENRIKSLYIKKNRYLRKLDCSENRLTKLSIKYNKRLRDVDCSDNRIKKMYMKYAYALREFDASDNKLTKLYFKKSTHIREINISDNRMKHLNLSKNKKLRELDIEGNHGLAWYTYEKYLTNHKYLREFTDAYGHEWGDD